MSSAGSAIDEVNGLKMCNVCIERKSGKAPNRVQLIFFWFGAKCIAMMQSIHRV
jgi:hypothetical protein